MSLLGAYQSLLERGWRGVFTQGRSHRRAMEQALAWPAVMGQRTVSRIICALGRSGQDWSADYKLFSRSAWSIDRLFEPVLDAYLEHFRRDPISVVVDDTLVSKTGRKIPGARWQRDPMSPPFHVNLRFGLRFLQAGLVFPHHQRDAVDARSLPIRFADAPVVKKPGKRATAGDWQSYRQLKKECNLSIQAWRLIRDLRAHLDAKGAWRRRLLAVLDGAFCNHTMFGTPLDRVELVARCRRDAKLCFPAPPGQRRRYDPNRFTPEQVYESSSTPWRRVHLFLSGKRRWVRYKVVDGVLWQRGSGQRRLRLLVLARRPYHVSKNAGRNFREPAYLLSTDTKSPVKTLLQAYFDRWQIEVNHRDEKSWLGVGQAQLRSPLAVPRHPAFAVACYSLLLLAAWQVFGPGRTHHFAPLPKWRKPSSRPSLLDLLTLLRTEINETHSSSLPHPDFPKNLVHHAFT